MSFDSNFDDRWQNIIIPAIESKKILNLKLRAIRVDIRQSGDSIISEINNGISHSQLVLADISKTATTETEEGVKIHRNENVLFEVGLAMAIRQPVEVILIRDDDDKLLFDVSHIPVIKYNPKNIDDSVKLLRGIITDRLKERELVKDLRFARTVESLGQFEINLIRTNAHLEVLGWKGPSYPPAIATALPRVVETGILRLAKLATEEKPDLYVWTTFGREVANYVSKQKNAT